MDGTVVSPGQRGRSATTRKRILEATIACLVEEGYARTSTSLIQERAGVSRGALTHQFPSKHALMVTAIQFLSAAREAEIEQLGDVDRSGDDQLRAVFSLLFRSFRQDLFKATIELWNAARTDESLQACLADAEAQLGARHRSMLKRLLDDGYTSHAGFDRALTVIIQQMRGTALTDLVRNLPVPEEQVVEDCVVIFEALLHRA